MPSDSDLERLFLSRESDGGHDGPTPSAAQASRPLSSTDHQGRGRSANRQPQNKPITNRHGLPLLSAKEDLGDHFVGTEDRPPSTARARPPVNEDLDGCDRKDKNGIPVLDHCDDLARLFTASTDETRPDDELADAFKRSLASDAHTMIKRKTGGIYPVRKLTLQERLKRYPRPQKQLDLHGATAPRAEQRADSFVRTAHADGLFTLRIIVGKGLHSEAGAVLPDVVEDRLIHLRQEGLVAAHRWEKGLKRKSGAVLVYLETPF